MKPTFPLRSAIIPLAALTLVFSAGCRSSPVDTVQRAEREGKPNVVDEERVTTDRSLSRILEVLGVNEATVSDDLQRVQVELRNTRQAPRRFNYQFEWFDDEGMIVEQATTPWRTMQIEGGEIVTITGVAPNPRVVDFRLKLMSATR